MREPHVYQPMVATTLAMRNKAPASQQAPKYQPRTTNAKECEAGFLEPSYLALFLH
jgi:hypothetical protein